MVRPTDRPANNNRRVWARVLGSQRSSDIAVVVYIRSPLLRLPVLFPWSTSWSRGRPDLRWASYTLSLSLSSLRLGVDRSSPPLSLSPSVPVVVQISQAAFILRLSDILYSLSLLGPPPPPPRYSCAVRYETRPSTVSRCATRSERGTRRASCSVPYLLDSLHAVRFHGSRLYVPLSLSLSHSFTIYIVYQATRIVEWCSPPSDGDKPKRYNAYEARDTNNTKGSATSNAGSWLESRDFP